MPPQRSAWITVPLLMLLFLGGGALGLSLAEQFAPLSVVAAFVGLFMLPLAFISGIHLWLGLALLIALGHLLRHGLRRARGSAASLSEAVPAQIPPGSFAFVPLSSLSGVLGGLINALLASEAGFWLVFVIHAGLGIAYGLLCWQLARSGWLPFPDEA